MPHCDLCRSCTRERHPANCQDHAMPHYRRRAVQRTPPLISVLQIVFVIGLLALILALAGCRIVQAGGVSPPGHTEHEGPYEKEQQQPDAGASRSPLNPGSVLLPPFAVTPFVLSVSSW